MRAGDGSGSGPRSLQEGRRRRAARTPPRCDSAVQRRRGRSADGVTGGEHGAKMDVTRCTYTPRNPYQGPREAGERADLLLPGLGGKGHQATRLGLDQHGWQYRLPPLDTPLTPPVPATTNVQQPSVQQGSTVMDGQSSRTLARQSVSLAEFPSWQRLSRFVPHAVHAMRAEPLDSGCQHAAPSTR